MAAPVSTNRAIMVTTPLGNDVLLLSGFAGTEAISQLFSFQLDVVATKDKDVAFDKLLGQKITVQLGLPNKAKRFFNGICNRVTQGSQDKDFTSYRLEIVPQFWLLTRMARSRTFQHMTVPDILKKVLNGIDVDYKIDGTFEPRDYCVQYRETDYNFASRLMEEEGIFYFFIHSDGGHKMVLANKPEKHPDLSPAKITFETFTGGPRPDDRILAWRKTQELRSGKYLLWDHSFELPHKHLEADKAIQETVDAGKVTHKLKVGGNDKLELYDFPGEYAQRFDGVDSGGGDKAGDLQKIFTDNKRTVEIRMQEEALASLSIDGTSNCGHFSTGHKFTVEKHFNADGPYVLTTVQHFAKMDESYRSGGDSGFQYRNSFTCIPFALPFRPVRATPKPIVQGTQTAEVVGPKGEEIFTDKYGRVKVQFFWDRHGKLDADSSCWVRVAQVWAGKRWGASFWPRIGQEVVVSFLEGDPDQPLIVGSVYNAEQMPPYLGDGPDSKHPKDNKVSGIKSNTTLGGQGYNEWRFDDTKSKEQIFVHAEKNMDQRVKNDSMELVLHDRSLIVGCEKDGKKVGDQKERVFQDKHLNIKRDHIEQIEGNMKFMVGHGKADDGGNVDVVIEKDRKQLIEKNEYIIVQADRAEKIGGNESISVGGNQNEKIAKNYGLHVVTDFKEKVDGTKSVNAGKNIQEKAGQNYALDAGQEIHIKAGMKIILEAGTQISLKVGGNFIDISAAGVSIVGSPSVMINSGGAAGSGSGSSPDAPDDPADPQKAEQAKPVDPVLADDAKTGSKSCSS